MGVFRLLKCLQLHRVCMHPKRENSILLFVLTLHEYHGSQREGGIKFVSKTGNVFPNNLRSVCFSRSVEATAMSEELDNFTKL